MLRDQSSAEDYGDSSARSNTCAGRRTKTSFFPRRDATRCVDPNIAMASIFASPPIGGCRSEAPQRFDNQYVFGTRCDVMGPVSTVITADSENAYSEVNLLAADPLPKRDTVLARRVGDCSVAASVDGVSSARARRR